MEKRISLIKAVLDIYRISQTFICTRTMKYGIGRGQWYFLNRLLLSGDGMSQEQLSSEMVVDSAHTARALKKLEQNGYITRRADPLDARRKRVYVTDKAIKIREDYHQIYKGLNKVFVQGFTEEEILLARSLLYRMRDNIASYMQATENEALLYTTAEAEDGEGVMP